MERSNNPNVVNLRKIFEMFQLINHIDEPTHILEGTLDLIVMSHNIAVGEAKVYPSGIYSNHGLVQMTKLFQFIYVGAFICGLGRSDITSCDPYSYCEGTKFPNKVPLAARLINCDLVPDPRDRCCLPQAKHVVCYGITVDGQYLSYDVESYPKTTDFSALCAAMARSQGHTPGKHSSAILANGGGDLVWRYGEWAEVQSGEQRIKNLACEIV
ncbi:hypothetical protein HELRODRAFT_192619 [Helobdella robusta]|uniref:Uncharacterized protein n=1 Tax=Helobdella robusta TaxID=6412 RepID=T1FU48_HELRO|nr:hypothetical protein HELRODRAFT_192619 [Helobdella robusta]ESO00168.1 hypothetical protein HELRODRAFT_192619 [Helobdella robusta]